MRFGEPRGHEASARGVLEEGAIGDPMSPPDGHPADDVLSLVIDTVATVAPTVGRVGAESPLIGGRAVLDSVGLVTLLVTLEQRLDNAVDLSALFMGQADPDAPENPFRTVASLADHLRRSLGRPAGS